MANNEKMYTVEFVYPHYQAVYYRDVAAVDIEDAKMQILHRHPDASIRAVSEKEAQAGAAAEAAL